MEPLQTVPYITVVQLSDSHLFADAKGSVIGHETDDSLQQVISGVLALSSRISIYCCAQGISLKMALTSRISALPT